MGKRYGLEIRTAGSADAPGLATLIAELGVKGITPQVMTARLDALARGGGAVLIAVEWGPPSGVVVLQVLHALAAPSPAGLIATLAVAADARRRGIGRLLIKAAARCARQAGCDRLLMTVDPSAADLAGFAAATGFASDSGLAVRPLLRRGPAQSNPPEKR